VVFGKHVHSDGLSSCKVFSTLVFAQDTHHTDFNFLLQIKDEFGFIDAIILLGEEKGVVPGHVGE
jgi:hypothetical protein